MLQFHYFIVWANVYIIKTFVIIVSWYGGVVSFKNSVYAYNETLTKVANIGLLLTYINRMVAEDYEN